MSSTTTVRIFTNVPSGIDTYTGGQPVTFGMPFSKGLLQDGYGVALFDQFNNPIPAQFEVTATWDPPYSNSATSVKWLLIDFILQITTGVPQQVFLKFGPDISNSAPVADFMISPPSSSSDVTIDTGTISLSIGPTAGLLGTFSLTGVISGTPKVFTVGTTPFNVVVEKAGPIRSVFRVDSNYVASDSSSIAQSSTRYRFYDGLSMVKIYHTMIWNQDSSVKIKELRFARAVDGYATKAIGFTPNAPYDATSNSTARQIAYDTIRWDDTTSITGKLDGYMHIDNTSVLSEPFFMGLRWPWQQFPTGFDYQTGVASLLMIGPSPGSPQSLYLTDIAAANVLAFQPDPFGPNSQYTIIATEALSVKQTGTGPAVTLSGSPSVAWTVTLTIQTGGAVGVATYNVTTVDHTGNPTVTGPFTTASAKVIASTGITANFAAGTYVSATTYYWSQAYGWECNSGVLLGEPFPSASQNPARISPRGISRTYEITLWFNDNGVSNVVKNAFIQQPVAAYADPSFSVLAGLPSVSTALLPSKFTSLENYLSNVFNYITRNKSGDIERNGDDDFGTWNWGDVQWQWIGYEYATYRYWMNNGKGFGVIPWLLYMRSGNYDYFDFGEAHSRHVMDVDICHVLETAEYPDDTPPPTGDYKMRGGVYSYSELHWSYGPYGCNSQETITADSEFLLYYYYLTGYERARDVIRERTLEIKYGRWGSYQLPTYYPPNNDTYLLDGSGRDLYNMLREVCLMYEASWNDSDSNVSAFSPTLGTWAQSTLDSVIASQMAFFRLMDGYGFPGIYTPHYIESSLIIAARVLNSTDALACLDRLVNKWYGAPGTLGVTGVDGYGGQAFGPECVWSVAELQRTGQSSISSAQMSTQIDTILRGRAASMLTTQPAGINRTFVGMTPYPNDECGLCMRDIVVGMYGLNTAPSVSSTLYFPAGYFSSFITTIPGYIRNVAFINKTSGTGAVTITIHFATATFPAVTYKIFLVYPDGSVHETDVAIEEIFFHTFGNQTAIVTIPAFSPNGVYAIDARLPNPPITGAISQFHIITSTGDTVVYYVPLTPQAVSISSYTSAGSFWVMPQSSSAITMTLGGNEQVSRTAAFDNLGNQVAEAQISSVDISQPPLFLASYSPLTWTPVPGNLYMIAAGNEDTNGDWIFAGIRPYVAAVQSDWFDPNALNPTLVAGLSLPNS